MIGPISTKLGMLHWGLKPIKKFSNDNPGLTMTFFTTRSNFETWAFIWENVTMMYLCAYARLRYQVSVYTTIGPLFISPDCRKGRCIEGKLKHQLHACFVYIFFFQMTILV